MNSIGVAFVVLWATAGVFTNGYCAITGKGLGPVGTPTPGWRVVYGVIAILAAATAIGMLAVWAAA